ncbi:helix-turn-helix domain-containing protein [Cupriavidus pinatubonensis]|uniref:helix-turn-helix domain-containing protein n=1 Tax=Cupriavidus pinatubonensis TaxID=248026 RepID=UPI003618FF44
MTEDSFAFRLKELLEHKKLTLQTVANALDVSRPAVHKWTKGGEIDYEKLRKLAAFLGVNLIWLRYGEQARQDLIARHAGTRTGRAYRQDRRHQHGQHRTQARRAVAARPTGAVPRGVRADVGRHGIAGR